jgi:osmoprotectant transport system ATP-binding protein
MINRLIEATSGKIFIDGKNIQDQKPEELRKQIGYVIQDIGLFPHYTVEQNVSVVPKLLKWDRNETDARTRELLELVGLPPDDFVKRRPSELSGGQQQRVGLARALAADPSVVLLDEPFGALDPITRRQIQKEFINMGDLLQKTMILVTHDVFEACEIGDRICLMDKGKIVQIGTAKELLFSAHNDFVRNFFQTNRFQLELMVLTLKDILEDIPVKEYKGETARVFHENVRILEVLEAIGDTSQENPFFDIKSDDKGKMIRTTSDGIMSAFYIKRAKLIQ